MPGPTDACFQCPRPNAAVDEDKGGPGADEERVPGTATSEAPHLERRFVVEHHRYRSRL